jgi:hypothetical protein
LIGTDPPELNELIAEFSAAAAPAGNPALANACSDAPGFFNELSIPVATFPNAPPDAIEAVTCFNAPDIALVPGIIFNALVALFTTDATAFCAPGNPVRPVDTELGNTDDILVVAPVAVLISADALAAPLIAEDATPEAIEAASAPDTLNAFADCRNESSSGVPEFCAAAVA